MNQYAAIAVKPSPPLAGGAAKHNHFSILHLPLPSTLSPLRGPKLYRAQVRQGTG